MTETTTFVTIADSGYLPRVRVLQQSTKAVYPGSRFFWVDSSFDRIDVVAQPTFGDSVGRLDPRDIVGDWPRRCITYDPTERATSLKGAALLYLLRSAPGSVMYLDPDMELVGPLTPIHAALASHGMVLTPHWVSPDEAAGLLVPSSLSRVGITNLGFMAARPTEEILAVLRWFDSQLRFGCTRSQEAGVFVDQRWADFLPSMSSEVTICRDPRVNTGWWNGHARDWGESLLVHFSGFDPLHSSQPTRHMSRMTMDDLHHSAAPIFERYARRVLAEGTEWASLGGSEPPYVLRRILRSGTLTEELTDRYPQSEDLALALLAQILSTRDGAELARSTILAHCDEVPLAASADAVLIRWLDSPDGLALLPPGRFRGVVQHFLESNNFNCDDDAVRQCTRFGRTGSLPSEERCMCGLPKPGRFS
jgi:hypothetical protein